MIDRYRKEYLQKQRVDYATEKLLEAGVEPTYEDGKVIEFKYLGETVKIFPYTGWFTGKTVKDGRGIHRLLKQLKHNY